MAPRSRAVSVALVGLAVYGTAQVAFVQPAQLRTAALAAALAAASVGGAEPANADIAKFSVFGFGGGTSDPYASNDADQPNPYSQFSNKEGRSFKETDPATLERKKKALTESFRRIETQLPNFIKTRQSENVKSVLTLQLNMMRANMEYVSANGPPFYRDDTTAAFKEAQVFFQDIADLGVAGHDKKWVEANDYYQKALGSLKEWKTLVSF